MVKHKTTSKPQVSSPNWTMAVYEEEKFGKERELYQKYIQDLNTEKQYSKKLIEKLMAKDILQLRA